MSARVIVVLDQADAVRANVRAGRHEVDVDVSGWTDEERGRLARSMTDDGWMSAFGAKPTAPTAEAVLAAVRARLEEDRQKEEQQSRYAAEEAERRAKIAAEEAEREAKMRADFAARGAAALVTRHYGYWRIVNFVPDDLVAVAEAEAARRNKELDEAEAAEKEAQRAKEAAQKEERERLCAACLSTEQKLRRAEGLLPEREERKAISEDIWTAAAPLGFRVTDEDVIAAIPVTQPEECHAGGYGYDHAPEVGWDDPPDGVSAQQYATLVVTREQLAGSTARLDADFGPGWKAAAELRRAQTRCRRDGCSSEWAGEYIAVEVTLTSPAGVERVRRFVC